MTTFDRNEFLTSLENPTTLPQFLINLETLIYNGEYNYSDSLSLFQKLFPRVKSPKGVRHIIIQKYKDAELAEQLYELLQEFNRIDCYFLQKIDSIVYWYI